MSSYLFLMACLGILYVVYWSSKNDRTKNAEEQTGFLKMRTPQGVDKQTKSRKSPFRSR